MHPNAKQRQRILELLYAARESTAEQGRVKKGDMTQAEIEAAVGPCAFALSVLAEIGHIKLDGFRARIGGAGVIACEEGMEGD